MRIMAVDPGNEKSALVIVSNKPSFQVIAAMIEPNDAIKKYYATHCNGGQVIAIEMIASYGMPVGKTVFDTVRFIGQLEQVAIDRGENPLLVYRQEVKLHFCHNSRAKDGNIRQVLIDRFGKPGRKKSPGVLYGLHDDLWQALAVAVYVMDTMEVKP